MSHHNDKGLRLRAVDTTLKMEREIQLLEAQARILQASSSKLKRSLIPLLEESAGNQIKLQQTFFSQTGPGTEIEAIVDLIQRIELEMFEYAHEKTRHTMLMNLHKAD